MRTRYIVGIVKLEEVVKLLGIDKLEKLEIVSIGMDLIVDFEDQQTESLVNQTRYYLK